jgi:protocatechuate 3,4-dioxygenase beta subunit
VRSLGALAFGVLLFPTTTFAQAPPRDRAAAEAPAGTARIRGQVVAADTGTPLRRAQVRASSTTIRLTRLTTTDAEGHYEFLNLPAGRYTITVTKAGYVGLEFGQRRPFEGGRPLDLTDAQVAEQMDFALPRGSVIAGRITDETGDPIIGASVQAMRYQYLPGGRRRLQSASQMWLSGMTNDLGEYRLFGLMPGTYVVSALGNNMGVVSLTQATPLAGGLGAIDTRDGFIQTYFPGTASLAEAQPVLVNLAEEANASFSLTTGRLSRISGTVRHSDGRPATGSHVSLRPDFLTGGEMGGWGNSAVAPDGSFSFANVPPGQFALEVMQATALPAGGEPARSPEFARMSIAVGGNDISGVALITKPGITISGRVLFPGKMPATVDGAPLRVTAASANPEEFGRSTLFRPDNGLIDETGRFQIRDVSGQVLFRLSGLPVNLALRSVTLNGVDITDRPYDTVNGDLAGLALAIGEPSRVNGTARNARGEPVRDFRIALFPANAKPTLLTSRFVRTAGADPNGRFDVMQLPAGEYVGAAVESFEQGEEWDPALQQRLLPAARRFAVKEGQTVTIELPYLE